MRGLALALALPVMAEACPDAPPPVAVLDYDSRYVDGDPTRSRIDPEALEDGRDVLRPVDDFLRDLAAQSDGMLESGEAALAGCLVAQMADWAEAGALAEAQTEAARFGLGSRLASFALILRNAAPLADPARVAVVSDWLADRMRSQMTFWETAPEGAAQGNLRAWAALAAAALAEVRDDAMLRGWAAWSATYVLCTATPEGALPQEMRRGRLALHYQLHALAPLVTTIAILDRQGLDMRGTCDGALDRAVRFALADLADGRATEALTGEPQSLFDGSDPLQDFQLAWLEAYLRLAADPLIEAMAAARRPLSYSKLGGNQTLVWQGSVADLVQPDSP